MAIKSETSNRKTTIQQGNVHAIITYDTGYFPESSDIKNFVSYSIWIKNNTVNYRPADSVRILQGYSPKKFEKVVEEIERAVGLLYAAIESVEKLTIIELSK